MNSTRRSSFKSLDDEHNAASNLSRRNEVAHPAHGPFRYEPLSGESSIRILRLHSRHWDSPIRCSLSAMNLDTLSQPYEAISYAWGDAGVRKEIVCNEASFTIPKSLYQALQVLRPREVDGGATRLLWADSICIDQGNTKERNYQVQLMRRIYTAASKVLIWLGHDDSATVRSSLDLVCRIASKEIADQEAEVPSGTAEVAQSHPESYYMWHDNTGSDDIVGTPSKTIFDPHRLRPLCDLFDCVWFTRLWVIQELVLSRSAGVFWGHGSIDFNLIGLAAMHVLDHYKSEFVLYPAFNGLKKCYTMYGIWINRWATVSFFDMLWLSRDLHATDPRDKIFGMLGLKTSDSDPDVAMFVEPNYTLSKAEVYCSVARKILVDRKEVDILAMVQHGPVLSDNWPSWVPDWTVRLTSYLCNGDRNTSSGTQALVSISTCGVCDQSKHDTVSIRGIPIDTVRPVTNDDFNGDSAWWHPSRAKALRTLLDEFSHEYDEETLAYTFTAGHGSDGYLIEDHTTFMSEYRAFLNWDFARYSVRSGYYIRAPLENNDDEFSIGYRYFANVGPTVLRRRLFVTEKGMLGLGPLAMAEGDIVAVVFGGSVPFVLRPTGDGQHYRLVGECYVHDIMNEQAVREWQDSGELATDFHIL